MKVTINISKIEKAARDAQFATAQAIHAESLNVIRTPGMFPAYPNDDGSNTRDIVDTGRLRDRNMPPVRVSPEKVMLRNDAVSETGFAYPPLVYHGYKTKEGKQIPPRPWWLKAANIIDVDKTFTEFFRDFYK